MDHCTPYESEAFMEHCTPYKSISQRQSETVQHFREILASFAYFLFDTFLHYSVIAVMGLYMQVFSTHLHCHCCDKVI